jgi:hypothetical protein
MTDQTKPFISHLKRVDSLAVFYSLRSQNVYWKHGDRRLLCLVQKFWM